MSDETKVILAGILFMAVCVLCGTALIYNYANHQSLLKQAACIDPDSVACILAVR